MRSTLSLLVTYGTVAFSPFFLSVFSARMPNYLLPVASAEEITLGIDSLSLACALLEGYLKEYDPGTDDVRTWICSSTVYAQDADTLFLIADSSAIDNMYLLRIDADLTSQPELVDYRLNVRFARGVSLPVREVAIMGKFMICKVYPLCVLADGYDYLIPTNREEQVQEDDEVAIKGFRVALGINSNRTTVTDIGSASASQGDIYSFSNCVSVGLETPRTYTGAPAFVLQEDGISWALFGFCVPEASLSASYTAIRVIPSDPSWLRDIDSSVWFAPNIEGVTSQLDYLMSRKGD